MCGRVIQSSAPTRLGIVEGLDVRASRFHNYPPRWNGAPSQGLLVMRRNHHTGEMSLDPVRWWSLVRLRSNDLIKRVAVRAPKKLYPRARPAITRAPCSLQCYPF
jgi:putative SOS response-associated peptidase YedK